jgi:hypothetical protein|tara:strand:+ start:129 stop:407 length:279 start_codon:yes stop_codon:yes gene_type:complete
MEKNIQCILLRDDKVLIGEVQELFGEIGEPDCKVINPYRIVLGINTDTDARERIEPWLTFTNQTEILIRSADVLTFVEPNGKLIDEYLAAIA